MSNKFHFFTYISLDNLSKFEQILSDYNILIRVTPSNTVTAVQKAIWIKICVYNVQLACYHADLPSAELSKSVMKETVETWGYELSSLLTVMTFHKLTLNIKIKHYHTPGKYYGNLIFSEVVLIPNP